MGTKESDLMMAGLVYLSRCLLEGDTYALRALGLTYRELAALREFRWLDALRLAHGKRHGSFLDIRCDRVALGRYLEYLEIQHQREDTLLALMNADAPRAMMSTLFGLSGEEYRRYRVLLGLPPSVGRPAEPDEHTLQQIWQAWQQVTRDTPAEEVSAEQYLALHQATGVPLRVSWPVTRQWIRRAEPVNIKRALNSAQRRHHASVT